MNTHPGTMIAATAAALTFAACPAVAAAAQQAPSPQYRTPVVLMLSRLNPVHVLAQRRPARFNIMVGGPSLWVKPARWSLWAARSARGAGPAYGADITVEHLGRVTLRLSAPRVGHGYRYYSRLHVIGGHNLAHYFRWQWSGPDRGWAPTG